MKIPFMKINAIEDLGGIRMRTKVPISKGVNVVLASMLCMGAFTYIPTAYAAVDGQENTSTVQAKPNTPSNSLSRLEIDGVQLDQAFSADVTKYTATVENDVQKIALLAASDNTNSVITVNGKPVTSGTSAVYSLQTGDNTFLITVNDGTNPPSTYTLTVTRKQSNNNFLQDIKISKGELSPKFDSSVTAYDVQVANEVDAITVTPQAVAKTSSIKVNDSLFKDTGISVQLPVGASEITIAVTAENGEKKTYTLHVTREAKELVSLPTKAPSATPAIPTQERAKGKAATSNTKKPIQQAMQKNTKKPIQQTMQKNTNSLPKTEMNSAATLSALTVSQGTWNKTFSSNEFTYHISESSDVKTITINASPSDSGAAISINGSSDTTVQLEDNKPKTIISVVVTKGEERKTYVLVFEKDIKQENTSEATTNATESTSSNNTVSTPANADAPVTTAVQNERQTNNSPSLWDRIVNNIGSFFNWLLSF